MQCLPIANHEMYSITENGEVYSGKLGIKMKPRKQSNGYLVVTLDKEQISLHTLVAKHFIPNPYNYSQVNHIDGNKENNCVANLEWCSATQNAQHALRTGLRKGFVHVDVVRTLLRRWLNGETTAELAFEIGKHPNTLCRMMRRQAIKDGLLSAWIEEKRRKRKVTACKNLELING